MRLSPVTIGITLGGLGLAVAVLSKSGKQGTKPGVWMADNLVELRSFKQMKAQDNMAGPKVILVVADKHYDAALWPVVDAADERLSVQFAIVRFSILKDLGAVGDQEPDPQIVAGVVAARGNTPVGLAEIYVGTEHDEATAIILGLADAALSADVPPMLGAGPEDDPMAFALAQQMGSSIEG